MMQSLARLRCSRCLPFTAALYLVAIVPSAAQPPQLRFPTEAEAQTLSVRELADRMFGASGAKIVAMQRPVPPKAPSEATSWFLLFATAPKASSYAGICEAQVFFIEFLRPEALSRLHPGAQAATPNAFDITNRYKIVGDPMGGWVNGTDSDLESKCGRAGAVIPPVVGHDLGNHFFWAGYDGHDVKDWEASFAAKALNLAKAPGRDVKISCADSSKPNVSICGNHDQVLARLPLGFIQYVAIRSCADLPGTRCVTAQFPLEPDRANDKDALLVTVSTNVLNPRVENQVRIREIEIVVFRNNR